MKIIYLFLATTLLMGCTSTDLVGNWKNPDIDVFEPAKILIVGMTANTEARKKFENGLKKEYQSRGVEVVTSLELFDPTFTNVEKTEEELQAIEKQLVDDGFDSILFTKVIGVDTDYRLAQSYKDIDNTYKKFRDEYLSYQDIFYNPKYYEKFNTYHAETSLYCICATKERELIWKGYIDVFDPENVNKTVKDYINLVVFALEEQQLIGLKTNNEKSGSL